MTIHELIKKLEKLDPTASIYMANYIYDETNPDEIIHTDTQYFDIDLEPWDNDGDIMIIIPTDLISG